MASAFEETTMSPALPHRSAAEAVVGQDNFCYRAQPGWEQLPSGWKFVEVAGVDTDSAGNVFVFNRGQYPVIAFDRQGQFLRAWGEGVFVRPHGIFIGPDYAVYCVDDSDHTVRKFTPDGKLLFTLGISGKASDTGATTVDYRTIKRSNSPFNFPTNLSISPSGELYIADGYGNARVHRFSSEGQWIASWGEPGAGPGQFRVPHGIAIDARGNVYVADRENSRIQIFSPGGDFITQWSGVARPCQVTIDTKQNVFVAELGYRSGMFAGNEPPPGNPTGGRVSIYNLRGELQARWGGGDNPCAAGDFYAPHDICVDRFGDVYVGEVTMSSGGYRGLVSPDCHSLQKFVRIPAQETP
jgi:DNA-binding beta-propeller fold protein YncE